jgi:hypothetical protein
MAHTASVESVIDMEDHCSYPHQWALQTKNPNKKNKPIQIINTTPLYQYSSKPSNLTNTNVT